MEKKSRQKYFVSREIRFSVAMIILWALLITTVFSYGANIIGDKIGHGFLFFAIIATGYIIIVLVLTLLFSHRLIGPFQRLKTEIKLIRSGDYHRRLNIRTNDDIYLKSFVDEVNIMLFELERVHNCKEGLLKHIDAGLMEILASVEGGQASREELREKIISFHKKAKEMLEGITE